MDRSRLEETLLQLVEDYHDVTASAIEVYHGPVDAVAFGRIVARGKPCIIKDALPSLAASQWTARLLEQKMGERMVDVAVTPTGLADSIVGRTYFVEPYTTSLPFPTFLSILQKNASSPSYSDSPILYLQSQNDNLRTPPTPTNDLTPLYPDVLEPDFASEFFEKSPEAINVWIGDERSVTSLHRDSSYHNLYTVIRGSKTFTMFPPIEEPLLYEKEYLHATYVVRDDVPGGPTGAGAGSPLASHDLTVQPTIPPIKIPWASVDPLAPLSEQVEEYPLFAHARPVVAVLERGDTLYMPPAWFHTVEQESQAAESNGSQESTVRTGGEDEEYDWQPCIALNWWYDREIGMEWAVQGHIARLSKIFHEALP